jgi:iron complex transport system ATP-binding protein
MAVTAPKVAVQGLNFSYPRQGHRLTDVSLAIAPAEVCCLLGPNGAGKTTLLRCVLNLLTPTAGTIRIDGQDVTALSSRQLARLVAYVPQATTTPFPFTALDIAVMGRTPYLDITSAPAEHDRKLAMEQLEGLGVGHLADRSFSKLSGGERQLVLLARALVQGSSVLVLDEPTSALDYGNEIHLLEVVRRLTRDGKSVLMTTHQPAHALNYADRAVLMENGAIIADGLPTDIVTGERLSALYGVPIHVTSVAVPGTSAAVRTCLPVPTEAPR